MVDKMHDEAQSVKLCEVLLLDKKFLTVQLECFLTFIAAAKQDLFMLSREVVTHLLHLGRLLVPRCWQLCKPKVLGAVCTNMYLQKYFLAGKLTPFKFTPYTT